jgi:hypothetical protein
MIICSPLPLPCRSPREERRRVLRELTRTENNGYFFGEWGLNLDKIITNAIDDEHEKN